MTLFNFLSLMLDEIENLQQSINRIREQIKTKIQETKNKSGNGGDTSTPYSCAPAIANTCARHRQKRDHTK